MASERDVDDHPDRPERLSPRLCTIPLSESNALAGFHVVGRHLLATVLLFYGFSRLVGLLAAGVVVLHLLLVNLAYPIALPGWRGPLRVPGLVKGVVILILIGASLGFQAYLGTVNVPDG